VVRPSRRREMAKKVVADRGVCIRVACVAFRISESCYRYERKLDAENVEVANWLIRLTDTTIETGALAFANCICVMSKALNGTTSVCIGSTRSWELNLRIKPRKRLVREKPEALTVPLAIN